MKLNIHLIIAILWSAVFLLSACSDDPENGQPEVPVLTFDKDQQLVFETAGGQADVHFTSTAAWTAEVDQDWCSVTPARGDATSSVVTLTVTANETPDERNATLILKSGTTTARMTFVQKQKDALTVTSNRVEVGAEGGEVAVEVKANIAFDCEVDETAAGWLSEAVTRSFSTYTRRFEVAPNEDYDYRSARVAFFNEELGLADTVTITQVQKNAILVAQEEYTVDALGGTLDFSVNTNVDFQVSLSAEWIRQAASTRGLAEVPLRFVIDTNPGLEPREAVISFTAGELSQSVKVIQPGRQDKGWLRIVHTNRTFSIPSITGPYFNYGHISWGDGQEEVYQEEAVHTYQTEGSHTVSVELLGAEEVSLPNLVGVTDLDLTQF